MECRQRVGKGVVTFPCYIPIPNGRSAHEGPCAANELEWSISARKRWEEAAPSRAILASGQSEPVTFSSMEGATPVPGSDLLPEQYRAIHQPRVGEFGAEPVPESSCVHPWAAHVTTADGALRCAECGEVLQPAPTPIGTADTLRDFVGANVAPPEMQAARVMGVTTAAAIEAARISALEGADPPPALDLIEGAEPWPGGPPSGPQDEADIVGGDNPPGYTPPEPTKQRPGDQVLPSADNPRPAVHEQMATDIMDRLAVGIERYGQPLKPMNGRDTIQDAYEEALDLGVYLKTLEGERAEALAIMEALAGAIVPLSVTHPQLIGPTTLAAIDALLAWLRGEPQT